MKVGKYYVSTTTDKGIERYDNGRKVICEGYYCQVYSDSEYRNQVDDFCLAIGHELRNGSEASLQQYLYDYLCNGEGKMTQKRKMEIIDKFLGWMIEHHNNDKDLYLVLKNSIGMTKEELNEFSIESLDEYYEKEQEKAEEETIETLTTEDVVEQAVYLTNAPEGATAEDKSEAMLGILGANIVAESVYEEPDYEKEVEESIAKEFATFKEERTTGKTADEVFDDAYEIHVKTQLKNAVGEEFFTPEVYKALYQKKGGILQALYDAYQQDPHASVTTNTDAQEFIEKYCDQNFPSIMNGDELAPTMGG